ncbi:hypothetical protein QT327_21215 [Olivibacter sp. 47]|uniref:hypothetical protein n=1 Tax=Olivibacter sp. 47 TaxID=3056486 RepID=UPI0025A444B8|nr:hypothetical protein [Olivibacter sp. 47]MDM8176836.1 hypothetical protein [Olivibacter sp. 47]
MNRKEIPNLSSDFLDTLEHSIYHMSHLNRLKNSNPVSLKANTKSKGISMYPLYFVSETSGCIFMKHPYELSQDGTPRYIINPNSKMTYSLKGMLSNKHWIPKY